jgi:hypothetical protein
MCREGLNQTQAQDRLHVVRLELVGLGDGAEVVDDFPRGGGANVGHHQDFFQLCVCFGNVCMCRCVYA